MKKLLLVLFVLFVLSVSAQTPKDYLRYCDSIVVNEFIYIQTDRPFYEPNDTVWLSVWVVDDKKHELSKLSHQLKVVISDPAGNIIHKKTLFRNNQENTFVFKLKDLGGIYHIAAFTDYTHKIDSNYKALKSIQVQNVQSVPILFDFELNKNTYLNGDSLIVETTIKNQEGSILKNQMVVVEFFLNGNLWQTDSLMSNKHGKIIYKNRLDVSNAIYFASLQFKTNYGGAQGSKYKNIPFSLSIKDLQFLPESGYLINEISSFLAFKTLDAFGKPVAVKGSIYNQCHDKISDFVSEHDGMGKIELKANKLMSYYALVSLPSHNNDTYFLPKAVDSGMVIQLVSQNNKYIKVKLLSNINGLKHIVFRKGNTMVYDTTVSNNSEFIILTEKYSMGVYEISAFDKNWQPFCSRLVFINSHKKANVSIEFDKNEYAMREKVSLKIKTLDENNRPIKTNFSLSVVNEQSYQYTEKYEGNILSQLYLEQELKGPIHLPAYYFNKIDSQVLAHLDLLMLTNGWRRIEFQNIQNQSLLLAEKYPNINLSSYVVYGNIYDNSHSIKDFSQYKIKILSNNQWVSLDKSGGFIIYGFKSNKTIEIKVKIPGYNFKFKVNPWLVSEDLRNMPNATEYKSENEYFIVGVDKNKPQNGYSKKTLNQQIKMANAIQQSQNLKSSEMLLTKQNNKVLASEVVNPRINVLSGRGVRGDGLALFVDGVRMNNSSAMEISGDQIVASGFRGTTCRMASSYTTTRTMGYQTGTYYEGPYNFRSYEFYSNPMVFRKKSDYEIKDNPTYKFYSPQYSGANRNEFLSREKDTRKTLFYAFNVSTDENGMAEFTYYNADDNGSYKCVLEGVASSSYIAHGAKSYSVKKPLIIQINVPEYLTKGDVLKLPLNVLNNQKRQKVSVFLRSDSNKERFEYWLDSNASFTHYITLSESFNDELGFLLDIQSPSYNEVLRYSIQLKEQYKDRSFIMSGMSQEQTAKFTLEQLSTPKQYIKFEATIGKNLVHTILQTLDGMITEPYGCFEQVSSVNFPNILAFQIMQSKKLFKNDFQKSKLLNILENGYSKLAAYETSQNGFEWYGRTPPHEGLSAYGLVQFYELKKLGLKVDNQMLSRTQEWLISRFNSNGSISVNAGKYGFSGASVLVTTAYVTWVLSQYTDIDLSQQIKYIEMENNLKFDAYISALLAGIYINSSQLEKGKVLNESLIRHIKYKEYQNFDANHSIVRSAKTSLDIEIMSISAINAIKLGVKSYQIDELINAILSKRNNKMYFGNSQATVWALSAFKEWSMNNDIQQVNVNNVKQYVNNHLVYNESIHLNGEILTFKIDKSFLEIGENEVKIEFSKDMKINYTVKAEWLSRFSSNQTNLLSVETTPIKNSLKNGDFYQMDITLKNKSKEGQGQTICIIPIPACMSLIPEQLKLLSDKKYFDYYEIKNNELILYYAELAPLDVKKIPIAFQVNSIGTFLMPNINAYLYYNPSEKFHVENMSFKIEN